MIPTARRATDGTAGVVVAVRSTEQVLGVTPHETLEPAEEQRSAALQRPQDRAAHRAAHLLVRRCAAALLGVPSHDIVLTQRCPGCGGEGHGKPLLVGLPGMHVSLSHSDGVVAAIAAWQPCGIDVERVPTTASSSAVEQRDLERRERAVLTPAEREWTRRQSEREEALLRLWTRKEALVKVGAFGLEAARDIAMLDSGRPAPRWAQWLLDDEVWNLDEARAICSWATTGVSSDG